MPFFHVISEHSARANYFVTKLTTDANVEMLGFYMLNHDPSGSLKLAYFRTVRTMLAKNYAIFIIFDCMLGKKFLIVDHCKYKIKTLESLNSLRRSIQPISV